MFDDYYSLNTICEFICLIVSIACLFWQKDKVWWWMVMLLSVTFITETSGRIAYFYFRFRDNYGIYNIYTCFEIIIPHLMFYRFYSSYGKIKFFIAGGLLLIVCLFIRELLGQHSLVLYVYQTNMVMSVCYVLYSLIYYYLQFKDDRFIDLRYSPEFWWVGGVLFFYFGATVCNLFEKQLAKELLYGHHPAYYIFRILIVLLYGFWSYSFICKKWAATT